jgi:c(7)-type cytochrome triheme protein
MVRIQKRLWGWILGGLLAVSLFCGVSICCAQPDEITLGHTGAFQEKQRTAVNFPHELHMGPLECLDCHHQYEDGKNVLDPGELEEGTGEATCNACHDEQSDVRLMEAFHRECIGCHIARRKAGKSTGPELCGECHPKSEK